jgi:hypothetical protein
LGVLGIAIVQEIAAAYLHRRPFATAGSGDAALLQSRRHASNEAALVGGLIITHSDPSPASNIRQFLKPRLGIAQRSGNRN